ncbi:hypothetical protein DXG03_000698, partial [Asterophora parasitica]
MRSCGALPHFDLASGAYTDVVSATTHDLQSSSKNAKVVINWSPAAVTDEASAAAETSIANSNVATSPSVQLSLTSNQAATVPTPTINDIKENLEKRNPPNSRSTDRLATVLGFVGVLVHPIAKAVSTVLNASYKVFEAQLEREAKVRELWDVIIDTLDFMEEAEPLKKVRGLEKTMQAIMSRLYDCIQHLKAYEEKGFLAKVAGGASADDTLSGFAVSFTDLKLKLHQRVSVENWKVSSSISDDIARLDRKGDLETLENIPGAKILHTKWSSENKNMCLPATRQHLLDQILNWVLNGSEKLYWLSGAAGTGKSSIANTVAHQCNVIGHLGAVFRFRRDEITLESPYQLFGNLAYHIAFYSEVLWKAVVGARHRHAVMSMSEPNLPHWLVLNPLKEASLDRPLVLIIDALDECVVLGMHHGHSTVVEILQEILNDLPQGVKILITSYDECTLQQNHDPSMVLKQDLTSVEHIKEDIGLYIDSRLTDIAVKKQLGEWKPLIENLVKQADNLFIWAA